MSMDNIRLKQEDVFGEHSVLTDINPVTNTGSIDDDASGEKLNDTLNRVWQAINNKLSRIVNSVNGRTGVVVLTSDDVGLGNVDNVSFADIKSWVIEQIENAFENKRLRLYDTYDRVIEALDANDKTMAWAPFFCDIYGDNDRRSVIGLFKWNPSSGHLDADFRMINTIGYADPSIIYRQSPDDYNPGAPGEDYYEQYADIPVGGIGVNIYKEPRPEDQILYLEGARSPARKDQTGLRLDHDKIGSRLYYEDTPYGPSDNLESATGYMLWKYGSGDSYKGYAVRIFINDQEITPAYWWERNNVDDVISGSTFFIDNRWTHYDTFRNNDVIVMRFGKLCDTESNPFIKGLCQDFSNRQPSIGTVIKAPDTDPADYIIKFYPLNPNTDGYGIGTLENHLDRTSHSSQLCVDISKSTDTPDGKYDTSDTYHGNAYAINMSGMNAMNGSMPVTTTKAPFGPYHTFAGIQIYTPWGRPLQPKSGLFVAGDGSICTYPRYQAMSTSIREGTAPNWRADTFYELISGGTYRLTTSEPDDWDYRFYTYYTKNDDDTYTRVKGKTPTYSLLDADGNGEEIVSEDDQICIGSLLSSNFAFNWDDIYESRSEVDSLILNPTGLNPEDGVLGTQSVIGVNLRRFSSFRVGDSSGLTYDSFTKTGYQFFNVSGLRLYGTYRSDAIGTSRKYPLTTDFIEDLGIADLVDANGHTVIGDRYPGGTTVGLGINVGHFLEITPKKTYRAETYWEGGKVQVRTGKGITEQIDTIDITDIIRNERVPSDQNFSYDYLRRRYITHPDEFYFRYRSDGSEWSLTVNHNQIEEDVAHKPDDWDTAWYKYEYNLGTDDDPDYVCLPYDPENPVGFLPTDPNYMGPYYKRSRMFASLNEIHDILITGRIPFATHIYIWKRPTNRLTVDTDPETLSFNADGQLTVVGGVGHSETTNIRFTDGNGFTADTYHGEEEDIHTDHIRVGDGLKLNGSDVCIPYDRRLASGNGYNLKLKDMFDNGLSTYELCEFIDNHAYQFDIQLQSAFTRQLLNNWKAMISEDIGNLPYTNVGGTQTTSGSVYTGLHYVADCQRDLLSDKETLTFGDARYNISETSYHKGDVRAYMAGTLSEIMLRVTNIISAIPTYVSNPTDANKIEQYVADHYGFGTVTSNAQLIEAFDSISIYNYNQKSQPTFLPLDWLFSFFVRKILIGGNWSNIVAGEFQYTQIEHRPNGWEPNGYASYFNYDSGQNVHNPLTATTIEYHPGIFYTYDVATSDFTLVTDTTMAQELILQSCYFQNKYTLKTEAEAPSNWATDWNSYYVTADVTPGKQRFEHVNTSEAPAWEANKYYIEDSAGEVVGYQMVRAAPAFASNERGTITTPVQGAPAWEANTFSDTDSGTAQESMPADWYTNYANYYRITGETPYAHVLPMNYAFKVYTGPYFSRELVNNSNP